MTAQQVKDQMQKPTVLVPLSAVVTAILTVVGAGWMEPPQPTREQLERLERAIGRVEVLARDSALTAQTVTQLQRDQDALESQLATLDAYVRAHGERLIRLESRQGDKP